MIVAVALAVAGAPARGTTERELTLDDALALGKKQNKSMVAERAKLEQAQTSLSSAWALLLPTIAAQGKYTRNYADFNFPGAVITDPQGQPILGADGLAMHTPPLLIQPVNQLDGVISFSAPLIVPAAYPGLKSVKANVHASEANYELSETNVLYAVAQAFYAAAISDEVLLARRSNIEVARATLDNARTRLAAGTVTKVDVDRAELALLRAEQQEREARQGRDQAYRGLATLIQIEGPFRVKAPEALGPPPPEEPLENVLKLRPEFRSIQMSAEAADLQVTTDALKWAPSISAFGNARKFNYDNFARDRHSWAVGVQLDWVLYDGGNRDAQRHLAAAQREEADARAAVLADSIRDDLANGRGLVDTKRQGVIASTRAVELAKETIDLVRTQYEAGTVTQVDLLGAQDALVGAQEALAQSRFDLAVADLTLRKTAGTFPPR
jgi:outer membrane protein/protease secretion system outer membrane protein